MKLAHIYHESAKSTDLRNEMKMYELTSSSSVPCSVGEDDKPDMWVTKLVCLLGSSGEGDWLALWCCSESTQKQAE